MKRLLSWPCGLLLGLGLAGACGFDATLREYLNTHFWLPFRKGGSQFANRAELPSAGPYAGMGRADGETPLAKLRLAYQHGAECAGATKIVEAARAMPGLTPVDREEVDLIDAKIDMRCGSIEHPESLRRAKDKLTAFLKKARSAALRSEARGWIAYIHYSLGDQTAAGKIYLDELNRKDTILSRETLTNSLRMTYRSDGGPKLREHLAEYFDTAEHAAFAIQLVTNPHSGRIYYEDITHPVSKDAPPYDRIKTLLQRNGKLFQTEQGAQTLATLGIRSALRAGDPAAALTIAANVPVQAAVQRDLDFLWMTASANFLSKNYSAAEPILLRLFRSSPRGAPSKWSAAHALCGVYQKTGNAVEQIRYALWLGTGGNEAVGEQSVNWVFSGFDLALLLDTQASIQALRDFLAKYPSVPGVDLVKYGLAVRLARENQYDEATQLYQSVGAPQRSARMKRLADLYRESTREDLSQPQLLAAKHTFAAYLEANADRTYFNNRLWSGFQRGALQANTDSRLTKAEREKLSAGERKLKDDQEELWRAHLILREIVREAGPSEIGRRAARLAIRCVRRINTDRFGRAEEIRQADIQLTVWLARSYGAKR